MIGKLFATLRPILRIARALERIAFTMEQATGHSLADHKARKAVESEVLTTDYEREAVEEWYFRHTGRELPVNTDIDTLLGRDVQS